MTDTALHPHDVDSLDASPRPRAAVRRHGRGYRLRQLLALSVGAFVGLTMPLGHRLPSGEALKSIITSPQIRVDLAAPGAAVECVCPMPVAYHDLPPHLVRAPIAYEDRRFRVHRGIDWIGLARALASILTGGTFQGGSTITQQLAKNMVVGNERRGVEGFIRKLREAIIARRIELIMSKDEILTAYLNTADFGRSG